MLIYHQKGNIWTTMKTEIDINQDELDLKFCKITPKIKEIKPKESIIVKTKIKVGYISN